MRRRGERLTRRGGPASDGRLSRADEANLLLDDIGVYVLTVVGLAATGGFVRGTDAVDLDALRAAIAARIADVPRLRSRLVAQGSRHRLEQVTVRIEDHVRRVDAVPGPDGLHRLCEQLATRHLPRDRPLWELLVVPGAHPGGIGWVFRVHHALADGSTAARIMESLFDPADAGPVPDPSTGGTPEAVHRGRPWAGPVRDLLRPLPRTALLGPSGPARCSRLMRVDLAALSRGAHDLDATVNDVVLAALGEGVRAGFAELGEPVPDVLPVSVPVRLPAAAARSNQVSAFTARVPLADVGVHARARLLAPATREAARRARSRTVPWFSSTLSGARVMRWFVARQRMVGVLSTNVRGPAHIRALCGAPLPSVWALPVIAGTVRLGVAAVSYAGVLSVDLLWAAELGRAGDRIADVMEHALAAVLDSPAP